MDEARTPATKAARTRPASELEAALEALSRPGHGAREYMVIGRAGAKATARIDQAIREGHPKRSTMIWAMIYCKDYAVSTPWLIKLAEGEDQVAATAARKVLVASPRRQAGELYVKWLSEGVGKREVLNVLRACVETRPPGARDAVKRVADSPWRLLEYREALELWRSLAGKPFPKALLEAEQAVTKHGMEFTDDFDARRVARATEVLARSQDVEAAAAIALSLASYTDKSNHKPVNRAGIEVLRRLPGGAGFRLVERLMGTVNAEHVGRVRRLAETLSPTREWPRRPVTTKRTGAASPTAPSLTQPAPEGEGTQPARGRLERAARPAVVPRGHPSVELVLDKQEYLLGENVLLHYRVTNQGGEPFTIFMGGDGRTPVARRAIRYKVEAADEQGRPAADPYPMPENMGGPGGEITLQPGQEFWDTLQLMRYRHFDRPGTYTIRVYHDLGWDKDQPGEDAYDRRRRNEIPPGPHLAPVAQTTIRLAMPDARQARQVVDAILKLPADANRSWGKRGGDFADFEMLRYPVYLPMMRALAEAGDERGLAAIESMAFPEATAALLELAGEGKGPGERKVASGLAAKAADGLLMRAPWVYAYDRPNRQTYLAQRCWQEPLKKRALALGWKLLAADDRDSLIRGAQLTWSLGGKDDLPRLIKAMDRLLPRFKDDPVEQRAYPRPRTASETAIQAARELVRRGAKPPPQARTPGQAVAFLAGLELLADFRPPGWQATGVELMRHPIPIVREWAMRSMPLPLDAAGRAAAVENLRSDFLPVQSAAVTLAGKVKSEAFAPALADVVRTTRNMWLLGEGFRQGLACGAQRDRLMELCAGRLGSGDARFNWAAFTTLVDAAFQPIGGYGYSHGAVDWQAEAEKLRKAWLEFIRANRDALRAGRRVRLAPPATDALFPPTFRFSGDPADWPAARPAPAGAGTRPAGGLLAARHTRYTRLARPQKPVPRARKV